MEKTIIVETGTEFGNMNKQAKFYPEGATPEEIQAWFLARRRLVGRKFGFDGNKMFMKHIRTEAFLK